jgi:hypothetical protein
MKNKFISLVDKHFDYLVSEYNFTINKEEESKLHPEIEGRVEYESFTTFVTVSSEQWTVNVNVGRLKDNKYHYFLDPRSIYEYLVLTETEKKLVCSLDPRDNRKAKLLLRQKRLLHKEKDFNNSVSRIESQLADYSKWLRQYADPFLRGDFSKWLDIYEFLIARQFAEHIRSGKDEFVLRFIGLDEKGEPVHEKRKIFQNSFDYLEKLKHEYQ